MSTSEIILLIIASFNVIFSFVLVTNNIMSALIFKVVPFFSAVILTLIAFKVIV